MNSPPVFNRGLVHRPTGRSWVIVCAENLLSSEPVRLDKGKYVLFLASERLNQPNEVSEARRWIDAGTGYMCAWGPASSELDDLFDYAMFLPELGAPLTFTLMTTWHDKELLEEALWFAFYNATAPDSPEGALESVVILTDTPALARRCSKWVEENSE